MNRMALEGRGHQVATAHTAGEAEKWLHQERPDVVVSDVIMETRTAGFELVRKLEQLAPGVPAILVSGRYQDPNMFEFKLNDTWDPVVAYLDKPVDPAVLADRIDGILDN